MSSLYKYNNYTNSATITHNEYFAMILNITHLLLKSKTNGSFSYWNSSREGYWLQISHHGISEQCWHWLPQQPWRWTVVLDRTHCPFNSVCPSIFPLLLPLVPHEFQTQYELALRFKRSRELGYLTNSLHRILPSIRKTSLSMDLGRYNSFNIIVKTFSILLKYEQFPISNASWQDFEGLKIQIKQYLLQYKNRGLHIPFTTPFNNYFITSGVSSSFGPCFLHAPFSATA